jgi:cytochrome c
MSRQLVPSIVLFLLLSAMAHSQTSKVTILDDVFSVEQAERGRIVYDTQCAACHGKLLEGVSAPALTGSRFVRRWREGMLDGIYGFIKERMPLGRSPNLNPISDREYLDLVTFILKSNDFPPGKSDLALENLKTIRFVGENGPEPYPMAH